jgi:hypothetical protein
MLSYCCCIPKQKGGTRWVVPYRSVSNARGSKAKISEKNCKLVLAVIVY